MKPTILTISDGNGVENDFKKWPLLLKILVSKSHNVINRSVVGASNEMIFMRLSEAVMQEKIDYAIIQWTVPARVDVIVNDFWEEEAKNDPVYNFNVINCNDRRWWVTSTSTNPHIKEYHNKYINNWHAALRTQSYMMSAAELLKFHNIEFVFSLCVSFDFIDPQADILNSYPWAWHAPNQGINEFRYKSQYLKYDYGKAQPHPLIGLEWVDQVLKPGCKFVDYASKSYYNVEQYLLKNA